MRRAATRRRVRSAASSCRLLDGLSLGDAQARAARAWIALDFLVRRAHELADQLQSRPSERRNVRQPRVRFVATRLARHEPFDDPVLERMEADHDETA